MLVVGLTGGVGAGKSAVASMLERRGCAVIDTDWLAREETKAGAPALEEIRAEFGSRMIAPDGTLDRVALAQVVFGCEKRRIALEGILHPRIRARWREVVRQWRSEGKSCSVVVIPLLFETGAEQELDRTACVACTPATQMERLLRRGWTLDEARRRIAAQWPMARKAELADAVIWNESTLEICEAQAVRVLE